MPGPEVPYEDVPAFVQTLREKEFFSRLALEFAIFTAARSGEVRGATWDEFDLEKGLCAPERAHEGIS